MKVLMSISPKFYYLSANQIFEIIKEKNCDGFEIAFSYNNEYHRKYLENFIKLCGNKYIIQFHGENFNRLEDYYKYFDYLNSIIDSTTVVFHSLKRMTLNKSLEDTANLFFSLLDYIKRNNYNITITAENLRNELGKHFLESIMLNNNDLKFTYDIGHEISTYQPIELSPLLIERLHNVHLHSFTKDGDHAKLYRKDQNKELWTKGILYLKSIKYNRTIVLECDLHDMYGNTLIEKIDYYLDTCNYIKEFFD
jgi:sugar phosphate isomerase/epimerase